jgi:hypothetical protein
MNHLDDGALQAFLDHEIGPDERAAMAEHLLGCEACHARYEELTQANALVTQSIALLDVEGAAMATDAAPVARRVRARTGTASFVRAAGLVLALAAAASAAVPGSPVRQWVANAIESAPSPSAPLVSRDAPGPAEPAAPAPAGLSIGPAAGALAVVLRDVEGSSIRLSPATGSHATVSVTGADPDPRFRTAAGRIELRNGAGGVVNVSLPLSVDGARLEVNGRLYAESRGGSLHLHVPADRLGDAFVW